MNILQLISKYRGALMGIAIIEVLLMHFFSLTDRVIPGIANMIVQMVYTQGFLFLSGFGIMYSLSKEPKLSDFYRRRASCLYTPYLVIFIPYIMILLLIGQYDNMPVYTNGIMILEKTWIRVFAQVTTISYWFEGNYGGMWYVSATVVLYAVAPLVYKLSKTVHQSCFWLLLILSSYIIVIGVRTLFPNFHASIYNFDNNFQMFFIGMYIAYCIKHLNVGTISCILLLYAMICYLSLTHAKTVISIVAIIILIERVSATKFYNLLHINIVIKVLEWLGRCSLEIYILHLSLFSLVSILLHTCIASEDFTAVLNNTHIYFGAVTLSIVLAPLVRLVSKR